MNALAHETSPYLLQHADNPVDWYPWGDAALKRARAEQKPILLSIGYSACHWCHVMAHESFEDEETAALMNQDFINIKVDREERPDIDKIYQLAQHVLTRNQGGWPLTMFLTPGDHVPFFGGTYFPREARYGLPGFKDILTGVARAFEERREEIETQNAELSEALDGFQPPAVAAAQTLDDSPLHAAREQFAEAFDARHGGFGGAPKFPHPGSIESLLRYQHAAPGGSPPARDAARMALFTLERMAAGGIHDHLGGGFCRYAVDAQWMIPHFEKMLYDNGPLLALYSEAWSINGNPLFARTAHATAAWVLREMTSPAGAFYSSLDADSEGEEGKYYAWDRGDIEAALGTDYDTFARRFGIDQPANFEDRWHLRVCEDTAAIATACGATTEQVETRLDRARQRLFELREQRIRPGRDDKILTSWNALMIKGLAVAGRTFGRPDYVAAAERALDHVRALLWQNGRLLATCKDGRAHLNAYLDDYAFLIDAILELLQARWRDGDLAWAARLADVLLEQYEDAADGGFFFTSHDHEALLQRTKSFADDALAAGNAVAARVLGRLGHLLGETHYLAAAERALRASWPGLRHAPSAHPAMLCALEEYLRPLQIIIIRGEPLDFARWATACRTRYAPRRLCLAIPNDAKLPGLLASRAPTPVTTAYICHGQHCDAPVTVFETFLEAIGQPG